MTLADFRRETADLPGATEIQVLAPWGEMEPAAFVERDDLYPADPILDSFPANAILITGSAD